MDLGSEWKECEEDSDPSASLTRPANTLTSLHRLASRCSSNNHIQIFFSSFTSLVLNISL